MPIYKAIDRETLSNLSTPTGFSPTKLALSGLMYALIQAIGGDVRITVTTNPPLAATTGHILAQNDLVELWGSEDMAKFLAVQDTGFTSSLEVTYFGSEKK